MWIVSYFMGILLGDQVLADLLPGAEQGFKVGSPMFSWAGPFWVGFPYTLVLCLLLTLVISKRILNSHKLWLLGLMLLLGWKGRWLFAIDTATPLLQHLGEDVQIRGIVVEQPQVRAEWSSCQLTVEQILIAGQSWQASSGKLLVQLSKPATTIDYGDRVQLAGKLELPKPAANPGQFDYRSYLANRGIYLTLNSQSGQEHKVIAQGGGNWIKRVALRARNSLALTGSKLFPGETGQVLNGMVLGASSDLAPELRETFNSSGLSHLLSVSGFHVALVAALPILLGRYWTWPPRATFSITTVVVIFYALVSGCSPPVLRSASMVVLGLFAVLFQQHKSWERLLAIAALLTTVQYPMVVSEPGYQLSFAATWAILALAPLLQSGLRLGLLNIPLAALLGTWPLVAYHFNQISLVSLPANMLLVDLAGLILVLGLLLAITGLFSLSLAGLFQPGLGILLKLFIQAAEFLASLPGAAISTASPSVLLIVTYYALLWVITSANRRAFVRRYWKLLHFHGPTWYAKLSSSKGTSAESWSGQGADPLISFRSSPARDLLASWKANQGRYLLLGVFLLLGIYWVWPSQNLKVTFLDVGEGDSIFIRTPSGKTILIDAGRLQFRENGEVSYDAGEKVVLPFLRSQGVNALDLLVITHPHLDHFGGAQQILQHLKVGQLLVSPALGETELYARLIQTAQQQKIPVLQGSKGQQILLDQLVNLAILAPQPPKVEQSPVESAGIALAKGQESHLNNQSLVLKLTYDNCSFLLTGDIEQEGITELMADSGSALSSTVLKLSHHGSRTGYAPEFYRLIKPKVAIITVGPNFYGHPHQQVLAYYQQQELPLLRTDQSGAVTFWTEGRKLVVETYTEDRTKLKERILYGYRSSRE